MFLVHRGNAPPDIHELQEVSGKMEITDGVAEDSLPFFFFFSFGVCVYKLTAGSSTAS